MLLGLDLIAAHMVGDYVLQTEGQAATKLHDWRARAAHVTTYCLPFVLVAWIYTAALLPTLTFVALLWVTHFITDSRRWASSERWAPLPILVDQTIHLATLAALARLLV